MAVIQKRKLTARQRENLKDALRAECSYQMDNSLLDRFLDLGTVLSIARGEILIAAGSLDDNLYILMEGVMRIWYMDGEREVTHAFGYPGCIAQSFHCYMGKPSTENYEACCKVKVLKITKADFDSLVENDPSFARWNLCLAQRQMFQYEVKRAAIFGSAAEKYRNFLRFKPGLIHIVPLKHIASYLGITREYLSKLRGQIFE